MGYREILADLQAIEHRKTADIDRYNKQLIKAGADVSDLRVHVLENQLLHRTFFQVSLAQRNTAKEKFAFIAAHIDLLQDWWHVDQLTQFFRQPVDFGLAFAQAEQHIASELPFERRWGYVLFLTGLQKDPAHTRQILSLIKDDDEYYVQMAEAWLIADLSVFNMPEVKRFAEQTEIKYNIMGKAIQKICDSFRIAASDKAYMKSLRVRARLFV
ncbi:MAG: DNA alkylation repair protein [Bacteroidaceae bacterium]|nr:DNA alkylation repair protein [Bacteroidaceae bacterium]MCF0187051.1 DNA alkylation repair protein [Bacteroidaceae bacterium]